MRELACTKDHFGGYDVQPDALPEDLETFGGQLAASLALWRREGCKVVLLEVPRNKAALVPVAVEAGFVFHFCAPDYLMLTLDLVENAPLVPSPTRFVGVGGLVFVEDKLLLVKNRGRAHYHLPGGFADPGEHVSRAVVREVYEETGVEADLDALVCFRHLHDNIFRKGHPFSDIYFVFRLKAKSTVLTLQASELEDGGWWPVDRALASAEVAGVVKDIIRLGLKVDGLKPGWHEGYGEPRERLETFGL